MFLNRKKTTPRGKTWRLAGETLSPMTPSDAEERQIADIFSGFQSLAVAEPARATMRARETALRACLGYFFERFGDAYGQEDVTQALSTALALPVKTPEFRSVPLAAALWILDYVEARNLQSEFLPLLPESCPQEFELPVSVRFPSVLLPRLTYLLLNRKNSTLREFRKLTALIRKEDAANLRAAFRDVTLDYFGRFLEVCRRVAPAAVEPAHTLAPLPSAKDLFSAGTTPPPRNIPERSPDVAFLRKTPSLIGFSPDKMQSELYYRRMTDLLSEFTVRDPYEICAASLLLERENDLLMNLNTLTNAVLACAEQHLPWARGNAEVVCPLYDGAPAGNAFCYPLRTPPEQNNVPDGQLFSVEQLFYFATGYLPPRDRVPSGTLERWFKEQGLSDSDSCALSAMAMAFSLFDDARTDIESGVWDRGDTPPGEEPDASPEPDGAERVAELTRQLKSAKQAVHDREQLVRQLEEQLRDENRRAEQDRMELRGLRDTLFRTRAGEIPEFAAAESQIQFPWQVRRRVLIFGGHDTWSKSIRPLLPGARFFQRESLPDLNAIKGADVVWIQANALSHKFYYRIIETARKENILVRYFSFASARKCAEQVVENELSETPDP